MYNALGTAPSGGMMGTDTLEEAEAAGRARRDKALSKRAADATGKLNKRAEKVTATDMRALWNAAAINTTGDNHFYCPALTRKDAGRTNVKLRELLEARDGEGAAPGLYLREFFTWVIEQWNTMPFRHGTGWMHKKDMLPRHPEMTFVVHYWKFFRRAYTDRHTENGYDYVSPQVDELRDEVGRLRKELQDAKRFHPQVRTDRLNEENAKLRKRIDDLASKVPVDLDSDLPEWEEEPND